MVQPYAAKGEGVRVVEFVGAESGIAAAFAGWQLAAMGADVARLVVDFDDSRQTGSPIGAALDVLADGKSDSPWPADRAALDEAMGSADILLCDAPAELAGLAGAIATLHEMHPDLVIGTASTFGLSGAYASFPAQALDAQAIGAVSWSLGS